MPIHDYRCDTCGHPFSALRSFTDDSLPPCPVCGSTTPRRLITAPAIVFKGSGWYKTDSRPSHATAKDETTPASTAPKKADGAKADGAKPDAPKSETTASTPATPEKKGPAGEAAS